MIQYDGWINCKDKEEQSNDKKSIPEKVQALHRGESKKHGMLCACVLSSRVFFFIHFSAIMAKSFWVIHTCIGMNCCQIVPHAWWSNLKYMKCLTHTNQSNKNSHSGTAVARLITSDEKEKHIVSSADEHNKVWPLTHSLIHKGHTVVDRKTYASWLTSQIWVVESLIHLYPNTKHNGQIVTSLSKQS